MIALAYQRQPPIVLGQAVFEQAVVFAGTFRRFPRPVVKRRLAGVEQFALPEFLRVGRHRAVVTEFAAGEFDETLRQAVGGIHARVAGRGEIAHVGVVRPLAVIGMVHQFRNDAVEIQIALAVGVAGHVHGNAVHGHGKIGAMVQVESAQEKLVGLAAAAVLGGDGARHDLNQFADAGQRARLQRPLVNHALRGGRRRTQLAAGGFGAGAGDDNGIQLRRRPMDRSGPNRRGIKEHRRAAGARH